MDWIEQSKEILPITYRLIKDLDYLIRETGECPTSNSDWVRIESMDSDLLEVQIKLKHRLGEKRFGEISAQIMAQIDSDIKNQLISEEGYIGVRAKRLINLAQAFEDSGAPYTFYEEESELGDKLAKEYMYLYVRMNYEKARMIIDYVQSKIIHQHES